MRPCKNQDHGVDSSNSKICTNPLERAGSEVGLATLPS
jgi:hypothetical protein